MLLWNLSGDTTGANLAWVRGLLLVLCGALLSYRKRRLCDLTGANEKFFCSFRRSFSVFKPSRLTRRMIKCAYVQCVWLFCFQASYPCISEKELRCASAEWCIATGSRRWPLASRSLAVRRSAAQIKLLKSEHSHKLEVQRWFGKKNYKINLTVWKNSPHSPFDLCRH